jgi:hypothetical protein
VVFARPRVPAAALAGRGGGAEGRAVTLSSASSSDSTTDLFGAGVLRG